MARYSGALTLTRRSRSVDVSKAERLPGVRAVITADDLPDITFGFAVRDQTVMAREKVVYCGQPICAVAADTPEIAQIALGEIEVDFEPLPIVLTIDQALKEDSTPIHPGSLTSRLATIQVKECVHVHASSQGQRGEGFQDC